MTSPTCETVSVVTGITESSHLTYGQEDFTIPGHTGLTSDNVEIVIQPYTIQRRVLTGVRVNISPTYTDYTLCDGEDGHNGLRGPQGFQGIVGVQGGRGIQGFRGISGEDGDDGDDGVDGRNGQNGGVGATGAQGRPGTDGGGAGRPGADGTNGRDGSDGRDGATGAAGRRGATGGRGPTGERGADEEARWTLDGADGAVWAQWDRQVQAQEVAVSKPQRSLVARVDQHNENCQVPTQSVTVGHGGHEPSADRRQTARTEQDGQGWKRRSARLEQERKEGQATTGAQRKDRSGRIE